MKDNNKDMALYAVKDTLANTFSAPFVCVNDAVAQRSFQEQYKAYPFRGDIQLFKLGGYDTETGEIEPKVSFLASYIEPAKEE